MRHTVILVDKGEFFGLIVDGTEMIGAQNPENVLKEANQYLIDAGSLREPIDVSYRFPEGEEFELNTHGDCECCCDTFLTHLLLQFESEAYWLYTKPARENLVNSLQMRL